MCASSFGFSERRGGSISWKHSAVRHPPHHSTSHPICWCWLHTWCASLVSGATIYTWLRYKCTYLAREIYDHYPCWTDTVIVWRLYPISMCACSFEFSERRREVEAGSTVLFNITLSHLPVFTPQAQNTCLNCWPSTLLDSFILLKILDYIEFIHSFKTPRQTNKELFHFKPLQSGTISLKVLDIPPLSPHSSLL